MSESGGSVSIDWTDLERLHAESLACIEQTKGWDIGYYGHGTGTGKFNAAIHNAFPAILAEHKAMLAKLEAAQAKIDALMLEHCPDEMTPEQLENWGKHQRRVSPERAAEIDRSLGVFK